MTETTKHESSINSVARHLIRKGAADVIASYTAAPM